MALYETVPYGLTSLALPLTELYWLADWFCWFCAAAVAYGSGGLGCETISEPFRRRSPAASVPLARSGPRSPEDICSLRAASRRRACPSFLRAPCGGSPRKQNPCAAL